MSTILLALAAIALAVATLLLFGWITAEHPYGWLAAGLFLWCLAELGGAVAPLVSRRQ